MNGRLQGEQVAVESGRESRSPIFKFKSSLKTSAIAFHAVVFGVHVTLVTLVTLVNDSEYRELARQ